MGFKISEFVTHINGKVLKPSIYTIDIAGPHFTVNDLWAEAITIPGRRLATQERRTFGPQRDMPYERLYSGDLDVTFMFSRAVGPGHQHPRTLLEDWMDEVINKDTNVITTDYSSYTGTINISLDDPAGAGGGWEIEVLEVYPKTMSPVQLGWAMNDEYVKQSVSFAFREYEIVYG